jgi:hypothetical protein
MIRIHLRRTNTSPTPYILTISIIEANVPEAGTVVLTWIQCLNAGVVALC